MTLVELTRRWKDKKIDNKQAKELFKKIKIFEPIEEDDEIYYTNGNNNSWLDVVADGYLTREERIKFKKIVGAIYSFKRKS